MFKNLNKIGIQILGWLSLFMFFFSLSNYFNPVKNAFIISASDTFMLFILFNIAVHIVYPRFYRSKREILYTSILVILLYSLLYLAIDVFFISGFKHSNHERPPLFIIYLKLLMTSGFIYIIGISLRLLEQNNLLREREKLLTEEKLNTELKLLKAQINPHFIFNALNNIYSLTYMKANAAPDSVLKLSDMLRYVFYDCNRDLVPLAAEIKYIENFSAFQQMKSDFTQNITLKSDMDTNIKIAPMLFIPFIENAFKYSRIEEDEDAYVNISIKNKEDTLYFKIDNSVTLQNKAPAGSGTGIKNVKHRLNIIYPEKYTLNIKEESDRYIVTLMLKLSGKSDLA